MTRLCEGKVLGTSQHPFKRTVTLSYLFKNKYDLNFNFILNYQEKLIYINKNKNKTKNQYIQIKIKINKKIFFTFLDLT